jgi:hypothetical protein
VRGECGDRGSTDDSDHSGQDDRMVRFDSKPRRVAAQERNGSADQTSAQEHHGHDSRDREADATELLNGRDAGDGEYRQHVASAGKHLIDHA